MIDLSEYFYLMYMWRRVRWMGFVGSEVLVFLEREIVGRVGKWVGYLEYDMVAGSAA